MRRSQAFPPHDMTWTIEKKVEVKLPTLWTDAAIVARTVREEKQSVERRSEKRKSHRSKHEKVEQSQNIVFCQCSVALEAQRKHREAMALTTLRAQNVKDTSFSEGIENLRLGGLSEVEIWQNGKSERHCGTKRGLKSNCTNNFRSGALLGRKMLNKCRLYSIFCRVWWSH